MLRQPHDLTGKGVCLVQNGYCFRRLIVGIDHALTPYFIQRDPVRCHSSSVHRPPVSMHTIETFCPWHRWLSCLSQVHVDRNMLSGTCCSALPLLCAALCPLPLCEVQEGQKRSQDLMSEFQRFAMTAQMRTEVLKGANHPVELLQAQVTLNPVPVSGASVPWHDLYADVSKGATSFAGIELPASALNRMDSKRRDRAGRPNEHASITSN